MKAQPLATPAPEDTPQPVGGGIGLAGDAAPDIARYLNVRSAENPTLSPDGSGVAFRTSITGSPQLWVTAVSEAQPGGIWPHQLTLVESVTFHEWSPAGSWIAYGADRGGDEREGYYLISPDGTGERELLPPAPTFRLWGGWSPDGTHVAYAEADMARGGFDIYVMAVADGQARRVHEGRGATSVVGWRPDGGALLLARARGADALDVLYLDIESGRAEALFEPDEAAAYLSFTWTPDGRGFYLTTNQDRDFGGLAFYDLARRELRWVETPERDVEKVALSGDGRFLAWVENDNGFSELRVRDLQDGSAVAVPGLPRGVINALRWAKSAPRLAVQLSGPNVPGDVWVFDASRGESLRATYSSTAGLSPLRFVTPEALAFSSHDGLTVYGLLYLPAGADTRATTPPVIINLHGGPTLQARPTFEGVIQYLVARGYAVFDLNFRGSIGYGKEFMRLDNGRLRPDAVKDIEAALDWLAQTGRVDASRAALMGVSYGGFMTLAALTSSPDRFRAGISFVGVSNWITALEGAPPQLKALDLAEYGDIDDPGDREFFRELSPLTHAARIRAPLMVIHGANDPRNPVSEADQIVGAVRERGGDVEYLRFPDEGHSIRKLSNRITAYRRMTNFLERTIGPHPL